MTKGGEFILPTDKLPDIFTVNDFSEEHILVRNMAREFYSTELSSKEAIDKIENKNWEFIRYLLKELAKRDVLGMEVPHEYGGADLDKICATIMAEELAGQGSFAVTVLAHAGLGTLPLRYFGTEKQKQKYLPKLISGEWVGAYCLTEENAGSDINNIRSVAVRKEDGSFVLNGQKAFITNAGLAEVFIVFAKIEGAGLSAFIVEKSFGGVTIGKEEHKMGIRGSSTAPVVFSNVPVPKDNLLGELGKGHKIAINILNLSRAFKLGAACLGAARYSLEDAMDYAKTRKQFGQPLLSFGLIRQKLARMATQIYAMQSMVYRTAGLSDKVIKGVDPEDSDAILKAISEYVVEYSIVKIYCSEVLDGIVDENVQIHGGSGFCESNAERRYRDSRINRIFEGTSEINRLTATLMLLKKAEKGDLPLTAAISKVQEESMTSAIQSEAEDLIERLKQYLNNARKIILLASGVAYQKFGKELANHQMIIGWMADCLIAIYKMESSLKVLSKRRNDTDELLVRLIFSETLFEVDCLVKKIISASSEGGVQKTALAIVRRFTKYALENEEELCNKIVESL